VRQSSECEAGSDCSEGRKGSEQSVVSTKALDFADLKGNSLITADVDNSREFEVEGNEFSELDVSG